MPAPTPYRREASYQPRKEFVTEYFHCPCGEGTITCHTVNYSGTYRPDPFDSEPPEVDDGPIEPCAVCGNADLTATPPALEDF